VSTPKQQSLTLIPHSYGSEVIRMRAGDGYINATAMCKAANRPWSRYWEARASKEFAQELSSDLGIPITELIQSLTGGNPQLQGTWIHPQVAIHLAQWLSPKFAVMVTEWVYDWMSGKSPTDKVWRQFEDRVSLVYDNVPVGYFCVFRESADLFAALITGGATFGTRMILDISVGQHWAKYWKDNDLESEFGGHQYFDHNYPSYFPQSWSNPQAAACYPDAGIPAFRKWMREIYLPTKFVPYLKSQISQGKLPASVATDAVLALETRERKRALPRGER